jgi:hypothetical protein
MPSDIRTCSATRPPVTEAIQGQHQTGMDGRADDFIAIGTHDPVRRSVARAEWRLMATTTTCATSATLHHLGPAEAAMLNRLTVRGDGGRALGARQSGACGALRAPSTLVRHGTQPRPARRPRAQSPLPLAECSTAPAAPPAAPYHAEGAANLDARHRRCWTQAGAISSIVPAQAALPLSLRACPNSGSG